MKKKSKDYFERKLQFFPNLLAVYQNLPSDPVMVRQELTVLINQYDGEIETLNYELSNSYYDRERW